MAKTHSRHRSGARRDRAQWSEPGEEPRARKKSASTRRLEAAKEEFTPPGGGLYGRRVGRTSTDLGDVLAPISSEERRAGVPSTARRNALKNVRSTTHALEDSATGKPSRKSTRRAGPTHVKPEAGLRDRAVRRAHAPEANARRASSTTRKSGPRRTSS